jgi:TIR domain
MSDDAEHMAKAPAPYDVFISHAGSERTVAVRLRTALIEAGLSPWASFVDIPLGAPYPEEIMRGVERCRAVVLLVSAASMRSEHVQREVLTAVSSRNRKPVLPIYIEPHAVIPPGLRYYLQALHRLKLGPDSIEKAAPVVAAALRDPRAWACTAEAPSFVDRLIAARRQLWLAVGAAALAASLGSWGLQQFAQQRQAAAAAVALEALPESLALVSVISAERALVDPSMPWNLRVDITLAGAQARYADVTLLLAIAGAEDRAGAETFDLTPVLAATQVGSGQMLTAQVPRLGSSLVVCLALPHPKTGQRWQWKAAFEGERSSSAGLERMAYRPSGAARSSKGKEMTCP